MKPFAEIAQSSAPRRELFEYLLQKEGINVLKPIERVGRGGDLPLSLAQERIWFLEQMEPGGASYNMGGAVRLLGQLDVAALERALHSIVARHESLRTTFLAVDGKPVQVIADSSQLSLLVEDLCALGGLEARAELERRLTREVGRPFDLERGPLLRAKLFRVAEEEYVLLLTMHHITGDAWSMGILVYEMAQFYSSFLGNSVAPLPILPIQYVDFAFWQRGRLQGELLDKQLSYWKKQLGGQMPILELPADRPRPLIQTFRGAHLARALPKPLLDDLKAFSKREGVTLFMTLLAGFQTLLARYTGQDDVPVGTPIAGRSRPETEGLIGLFINTLVMRTDLGGNPTFRELLERVRNVVLGAFEHQDLPFGRLVAELQPKRDLSHPPVFQVMFVLQNVPASAVLLPGVELTPFEVDSAVSKLDLTLEAAEEEEGLTCRFEYNTDLFDSATIERMAAGFRVILERLLENPEEHLWGFSLLVGAEREQVVQAWNKTESAFPQSNCIHEIIEKEAERSPQSIAVTFGTELLTYGELNRRANQLAHYLRACGIGPETLVGIFVDRSLDMVVGLLAILKAGGAYVPLDPAYPADRISFMIRDARMRTLLTHERGLAKLPLSEVDAVCLDHDWSRIAEENPGNPSPSATPDNLAYVIYTSGSTGQPKGVEIPHRTVVNFLASMRREPGIAREDVLVAVTTLSFDIAALELFLPLTVGARIVIAERQVTLDVEKLGQLLATSSATVMQATPAMWRMLVNAGWEGQPGLKILSGGEVLTRDLADQLLSRSASLWNMYGPTETTIWSAVDRVSTDQERVVIGRPIANTETYVLDRWLNPVPIGVPGELYIGGVGLARGYWNRPELTKERFIPDPFRTAGDRRLYKTGDLVRYLANGTAEFLGRIDHQVKLRGFRIELGEIEATLQQFPAVRECVVTASEETPGDKRLVAYFVPSQQPGPSVADLRNHLREKLPEHMIPSFFVPLNSIPRTPNGKVNRRALPAPDQERPTLDVTFAAPQNEVETKIAAIWQRLLRVEKVGRHDNFFDLGGHSLLMVQAHSALLKTFEATLTILDLFRYPTVRSLAEFLSQGPTGQFSFEKVRDRAESRRIAMNRNKLRRLHS